jgi:hypothetical protein
MLQSKRSLLFALGTKHRIHGAIAFIFQTILLNANDCSLVHVARSRSLRSNNAGLSESADVIFKCFKTLKSDTIPQRLQSSESRNAQATAVLNKLSALQQQFVAESNVLISQVWKRNLCHYPFIKASEFLISLYPSHRQ